MPRRQQSTNFYARALAQEEQQALERARVVKGLCRHFVLAFTNGPLLDYSRPFSICEICG